MNSQSYTLPDDAPERLVSLLNRWQDVSKDHPPTPDDLVFDDLVTEHPGLFWVELTPKDAVKFDMKIIRVGPEQTKRNCQDMEGRLYSQFELPFILERARKIYPVTLETGVPHYWEMMSVGFGKPPLEYVRLLLPLYDDDGTPSTLLGSTIWSQEHES